MIIDLHAHQLTLDMFGQHPFWGPFREQGRLRIGKWTLGTTKPHAGTVEDYIAERWTPEKRVAEIDAAGIDKMVVGLPLHYVMYHAEPDFNIRYARTVNESLAAFCAPNPERFYFWAHAPMQAPVEAAKELERAVTELGAQGLQIGATNFGDRKPHDPGLFPVWEKACELGVPVFVHGFNQSVTWGGEDHEGPVIDEFDTTSIVGMNADEALFFWYLTNGGVIDQFPDLKVIITHGGGFVPFQLRRFDATNKTMAPDSRNKRSIIEYLPNFYFDLDVHSPYMRRAIIDEVGIDQVVYGDNFGGADGHIGDLTDGLGLSNEDREKIKSGNALKLIKL